MRNKRYYIAYGSNLSVEQMAYRCPDAKIVGTASLDGWKLLFKRFATIERQKDSRVPVLVWEISEQDEKNLDRYEGFPTFYDKKDLTLRVTTLDEKTLKELTAMVYIMDEKQPFRLPTLYYYDVLVKGYEQFGFDQTLLHKGLTDSVGTEYTTVFEKAYERSYGDGISE
jgi:hypothetical protein